MCFHPWLEELIIWKHKDFTGDKKAQEDYPVEYDNAKQRGKWTEILWAVRDKKDAQGKSEMDI